MSRSKDWRRRGGVCLVNGKHTPGSPWERECPLLNQQAAEESDRNPLGDALQDRPCRGIAGRPEAPSSDPHKQRPFGGRFRSTRDLPENSRRAGVDRGSTAPTRHGVLQRSALGEPGRRLSRFSAMTSLRTGERLRHERTVKRRRSSSCWGAALVVA